MIFTNISLSLNKRLVLSITEHGQKLNESKRHQYAVDLSKTLSNEKGISTELVRGKEEDGRGFLIAIGSIIVDIAIGKALEKVISKTAKWIKSKRNLDVTVILQIKPENDEGIREIHIDKSGIPDDDKIFVDRVIKKLES